MTALIYYTNEPTLDIEYERLILWLEGSADPVHRALALHARSDLLQFNQTVEMEVQAMLSAHSTAVVQKPVDVFRFSNRLAKSAKCLHLSPKGTGFESLQFSIPVFSDTAYRVRPLSHPTVLAKAIDSVSALCQDDCYYLITKSHGNETSCLTSLLSGLLDESECERFLLQVDAQISRLTSATRQKWQIDNLDISLENSVKEKAETGGQVGLGQVGLGQVGLGEAGLGEAGLGQAGLGQVGLGQVGLGQVGLGQVGLGGLETRMKRELLNGVGSSKEKYLQTIRDASIRFKTVLVEACDGHFSPMQLDYAPQGTRFLTSKSTAPYSTIDYFKLLTANQSLDVELQNQTSDHFELQTVV